MAELKTKPTKTTVDSYLAAIEDEDRREDCRFLSALMRKVTGEKPVMWGDSIVGFGRYHYAYDSGHSGDACQTGFSSRKSGISVYLFPEFPERDALLQKLGRHKMGKGCLTIRRLSDIDPAVLQKLVARSVEEVRRRYP